MKEGIFLEQKLKIKDSYLRELLLKEKDFNIFTYKEDLICLIKRGAHSGSLNGYVGVSKNHPYYEVDYNIVEDDPNIGPVHGGLTFSGKNILTSNDKNIWWFGFDTAHSSDILPFAMFDYMPFHASYKDIDYVENQVLNLARDLYNLETFKK